MSASVLISRAPSWQEIARISGGKEREEVCCCPDRVFHPDGYQTYGAEFSYLTGKTASSLHRGDARLTGTAGTLDHPELLLPTFHICSENELIWVRFDDGQPRQEGFVLDGVQT